MDINDDTRPPSTPGGRTVTDAPGDADVVTRALNRWTLLATHLSALIGEAGFSALYGRTVRLVLPDYPCLTKSASSQPVAVLLLALKENLASIDPAHADQANAALLATFVKLLSGLIGEALTARLLNTAWAAEPEEKNK